MKRLAYLDFERFPFDFPAVTKPVWSGKVDRWYQLDAMAYGLAQACFQWRQMEAERPSFLLLASRGASNDADRAFAESGAASPAKFVHTLPSVRSSTVCQVMDWHGPMLCLQEDPSTLCTALIEAVKMVSEDVPVVWILSTWREGSVFSVVRLILRKKGGQLPIFAAKFGSCPPFFVQDDRLHSPGAGIQCIPQDVPLLTWLENSSQNAAPFTLFQGLKLVRSI
ncbi:MAG: hypothetical protein ACOYOS_12630 [Syntrophales bacterium]